MKQFWTDSTGAIEFAETALTPDYSLVTGVEKNNLWDEKYGERSEDGQSYYRESQRNMYLAILDGIYTFTEVKDYESYTTNLADQIFKGDWLIAQDTCNNLALNGIFDAVKKSEIKTYIDNYIIDNY